MANNFWKHASDSFTKSVPYGATAYLTHKKQQQSVDEKLAEKQQKIAIKNQQTKDYAQLTGLEAQYNEFGEAQLKTPEGWKPIEPSPEDLATLFPQIGNEYQQAYTNLMKQNAPDYVGSAQRVYNEETGVYDVKQMNKKSGQIEVIGTDPDYNRAIFDQTIRGEIEIDGQKFGTKGRDTRIKVYEKKDKDGNPYVESLDLGMTRTSGGKSAKNLDDVDWLAKVSDIDERLDNIKLKQNQYFYGKFPPADADGDPRELVRTAINSDLNEVATQYMKMGSEPAKDYMVEIFKEGKDQILNVGIAGTSLSRKQYYEMKRQEVSEAWIAGEWSERDATLILNFLDAKFNQYVPSQNTKRNQDDMEFDDILNSVQLEKK